MKFKLVYTIIFLLSFIQNSNSENNLANVDNIFHIGKMDSHNKNFVLFFKTREKTVLARGEEFNYITDYPQDLYIYDKKTKETNIVVEANLDGKGSYKIDTKIGFLNHMLEQLSKHSLIDLKISAKGDTHIDLHHTTEDTGIATGECIKKALGSSKGIRRYAHALIPMDETLTRVTIDVSNRPYLIWKVKLKVEKLGEMDTELFKEWFQAFSQAAGITLHIENIYGDNSHHIIESCFKGLARSLRQALEIDKRIKNKIPSTKGTL